MDLELRGQRALITGASKGIGRAIAETMAEEGCHLELAARDEAALLRLADELRRRHGIEARAHRADLKNSEEQQRLVAAAGAIDILINNAGSNPPGGIEEVGEELWRESWDLKVFGYINIIRLCFAAMRERGHGVIINVIGMAGERANARYVLGSAGNAGLMGLTRALGGRSSDFGIRVVGVNPGLIATERATTMLRGWSQSAYGTPERWREFQESMDLPFGRMGEPREVADVVAFLASPRSSYVSGTIVTVDGGSVNRSR
ncbi:MAG TPA: short-chain dehydrogenase/reductase [Alphaproteobacteria bacterium]|nr:short-chain dehydrogenase/reductase [Alphaproteobacteria bacterium]